jgi:hypothetical protein
VQAAFDSGHDARAHFHGRGQNVDHLHLSPFRCTQDDVRRSLKDIESVLNHRFLALFGPVNGVIGNQNVAIDIDRSHRDLVRRRELPVAREVRRALKKTVSPDFILNLTETGRTIVFEDLTFGAFFFMVDHSSTF